MTYFELYEQAIHKLNCGSITFEEFQKMVEPLNREIPDTDSDDTDELCKELIKKFFNEHLDNKNSLADNCCGWISVDDDIPTKAQTYVVAVKYRTNPSFITVQSAYFDTHFMRWLLPLNYPAEVVAWLPVGVYEEIN